jgi:hypothetical protein
VPTVRAEPLSIRLLLIAIALGYLALLLMLPLAAVFIEAFRAGVGAYLEAIVEREARAAIFLTLIEGLDGKVGVAWHSVEDAMSKNQVDAYVKDAIHYHRQNQGDWS